MPDLVARPKSISKDALDRLIWLTHEMHDATERTGYGQIRVTRKDWRLVRQIVDRLVDPMYQAGVGTLLYGHVREVARKRGR